VLFNEWYWDPIFHAIVWTSVVTGVALLLDLLVRFGLRLRPWPPFGVIPVVVWVVGGALILGDGLHSEYERPARESRAVARTLSFTAYEPRPLPRPFVLTHARAGVGFDSPIVSTSYDTGDGSAHVTQERRPGPGGRTTGGRCLLPDVPCREVRTPKGIRVLLAPTAFADSVNATAVLGGTLVSVTALELDEAAVLAYIDSLQAVDPTEIEFSRA